MPFVGLAPFTDSRTLFANLGDGTYQHSGILAIRQALAATRAHHLQAAVQRRGGDDRRPAGRGRADRAEHRRAARRRGREAHRHRGGRGRPAAARARPAARAPRGIRATNWTPCSARCATIEGVVGADLRPGLRHRKAPPPQARIDGASRRGTSSSTRRFARTAAIARRNRVVSRSSRWRPRSAASAASIRRAATSICPA